MIRQQLVRLQVKLLYIKLPNSIIKLSIETFLNCQSLKHIDLSENLIVIETGSLAADTWTKVTKTIPGNSNLQFDNNNAEGLLIDFAPFYGTNFTGTRPLNAWAAYDGATRFPDFTTTWFDTGSTSSTKSSNAFFEILTWALLS